MHLLSFYDKNIIFASKKRNVYVSERGYKLSGNVSRFGTSFLLFSALVNSGVNTVFKAIDAYRGDDLEYYREQSKTYLKPFFSIPSKWHDAKISLGTPWYY